MLVAFFPVFAGQLRAVRRMLCGILCAGIVLLSGCFESRELSGVVAEVNGVPIYFNALDAQRNILFSGLSREGVPPPDHVLQEQYRYALRQLVIQELARQYMGKHKIPVDTNRLVSSEVAVQSDYPDSSFREALVQSGLSPAMWHGMMTRNLYLATFAETVLRPKISITAAEVEKLYTDNKADFSLPEQWHFMQITGENKEVVEKARDVFLQTRNATQVQQTFGVRMRDIRMDKERLPIEAVERLANLAPHASSPVVRLESDFRTYVMLEKLPPTMLDAAEIYKRVEARLVEEKVHILLSEWVEEQLLSAKIRIAGQLQAETVFPLPQQTKKAPQGNATLPRSSDDVSADP